MTKQQVIDILEAYKPSSNIYNGYNSIEEKIDERICYLIDEIIERVKREPSDWIKCSEQLPKPLTNVLVCFDNRVQIAQIFITSTNKYWDVGDDLVELNGIGAFTHWMPLPSTEEN